MRAIMVMFDTLNRRYLPPYGAEGVHAPNFERLARRTATFDNCYAGSMPCMPARRELHTGRYNFLHRSWGPLEPFDDSVPEMLGAQGVHTHLATDHYHYWEDGGATYHNRFTTYEFFRGQEGDKWKGQVADPEMPVGTPSMREGSAAWRQDFVNRAHMRTIDQHYQTQTFDAGLEFIAANKDEDRWFLQVETFDPHEPFFSYDEHRSHYTHEYDGPHFDWPNYSRVSEDEATVEHVRAEYKALLTMCDASLGRILDVMDEHQMWDDTMLIVCTDHGFLLGERGWWGKIVMPWYDENIHTPLFIWDPRSGVRDERRASLVQTIDLAPTLLDFFGVEGTPDIQGKALAGAVAMDTPVREAGLFGAHGGHVNVTDGRYVYMRACVTEQNEPLEEYTLMPTHMKSRFSPSELQGAALAEPRAFTKGAPTLRVPATAFGSPHSFGTLLFDLENDPGQERPIVDDEIELRMIDLMVRLMRENDAPASQFQRLGLPETGATTEEHLLLRSHRHLVESSFAPLPPQSAFRSDGWGVLTPIADLVAHPPAREIVNRHLPLTRDDNMLGLVGAISPFKLASLVPALSAAALLSIEEELGAVAPAGQLAT